MKFLFLFKVHNFCNSYHLQSCRYFSVYRLRHGDRLTLPNYIDTKFKQARYRDSLLSRFALYSPPKIIEEELHFSILSHRSDFLKPKDAFLQ